jgi:inhibitor of cysteine peptidase
MFLALILSTYLVSFTPLFPNIASHTCTTSPPVPTAQPKQQSLQPPPSPHTSQSMSEVTLSQADSGTVLTLKRGQTLILCLDENSTTGYRWSLPALDTEVLQLKSDEINLPSNPGIGSGRQRVFTFQANNPGRVKLQLKNLREWVGDESTIEEFQVSVQVSE